MSACASTFLVLATILGPVTLVFMAVSFGTDHWLEFDVDYTKLSTDENSQRKTNGVMARYYHTRDRGIFRECYPGSDNEFLDLPAVEDDTIDGYCFYVSYNMPEDEDKHSDEFTTRLHLNRCFLAFYIIGIVLFLLAYIFGLVLCCVRISRWAYVAGIFAFSSAFSVAAAIAFFHGAEYIERNKLDELPFYSSWTAKLKDATDRDYGWSYALGWVGMILAALTATFYSILGYYITSERYEDREVLDKHSIRDRPMGMEPVYAVGSDAYYTKQYGYPRAYLGPMAPEYYARYPTAVGYGEPQKDMWHWREVES